MSLLSLRVSANQFQCMATGRWLRLGRCPFIIIFSLVHNIPIFIFFYFLGLIVGGFEQANIFGPGLDKDRVVY